MSSACAAQARCRDADLADMEACADIFNRWVDATAWMPRVHPVGDVVRHYRESVFANGPVIVADCGGEIAGFLALSADGFVTALYLDESHRGVGIGTALLREAKKRAKSELRLWTFEHDTSAQRFYEREGFVPVRRTGGENEERLPDILYHWRAEPLSGREA
ncbi:GNAT family N-acetyltransferase [Sinorhizobium terangae]|uniref:GNAT family N-acetyltransferase n=1 Tax=Sinorhizobium terangae TaxID=110322 RepID=A0A6N7LHA6_SINTE|nr:GNAT family N-acetyltransferase [Sinorhizobium terangae]MQX16134.1 GNAT family N-acetyltransferase [Sinorhizobium terangae]